MSNLCKFVFDLDRDERSLSFIYQDEHNANYFVTNFGDFIVHDYTKTHIFKQ